MVRMTRLRVLEADVALVPFQKKCHSLLETVPDLTCLDPQSTIREVAVKTIEMWA